MTARLPGNLVGGNLGAGYYGPTTHVPCNLGVGGDGPDPPDPPDPPYRGARLTVGLPWGLRRVAPVRHTVGLPWRQPVSVQVSASLPFRSARVALARLSVGLPWRQPALVYSRAPRLAWRNQRIAGVRLALDVIWAVPTRVLVDHGLPWRPRTPRVSVAAGIPWRYPVQQRITTALVWDQGRAVSITLDSSWRLPVQQQRDWHLPWGQSNGLPWIVRPPVRPPRPPHPPGLLPGRYVGAQLGCAAWAGPFSHIPARLGSAACYNVRPRRRVYVIRNEISVVRLPDRTPIGVISGDITLDVGSYAHAWSLELATAADYVLLTAGASGAPRQVEITLNGHTPITGIVTDRGRDKRFAQHRWRVSGLSRTALLGPGQAPPRSLLQGAIRLASQLCDDELMDTGFTLDYDTVDFTVPAGTWSYNELTPIEAIVRVAAATGAVVQSDLEDLTVHVRPRYPVLPWDWTSTAFDVALTDDLPLQINERPVVKPLFNEVFVSSEAVGVQGFCQRAGEGGGLYAPPYTHPLIIDAAVHQAAGAQILADRGRQTDVVFADLPLFPAPILPGQTGLFQPLQLVEVTAAEGTWHGLITRNQIRFARSTDGKGLTIHQTINIERHNEDAD